MDNDKFTIDARHVHYKLRYKSSFRDWWADNVEKLRLVDGEDFCVAREERYLLPTAARRVILSSRWYKRPGAVELLASLNDVAPARPAQTPAACKAVNVWPWAGAENLYDPAVVGAIERDSPTGKRRYQIRRTPTTKAEESPWLKDADALEHWLISRGVCLVEKWNLPVPIHADATLDLVRYRVGGKRLYCYTRGTFIVVSEWLQNGEELEVWLRGMGACVDEDVAAAAAKEDLEIQKALSERIPQLFNGAEMEPGWPTLEEFADVEPPASGPCPKCKAKSGNDWSQCDGACPMPMSPHYQPVPADRQFGGQANNRAIEAQKAGTAPDPFVPPLEKVKSSWPPPEMMAEMLADMNEMEAAADAEEEPYPHALEIVPAAAAPHDPYALGFEIVNADPDHEPVYYTEWGPEALDLVVVPPSCPYPLFPVNARALHTYMQIGKYFANWIKDRIGKFQFVYNVDFVVFAKSGKNPQGGRPSAEYWLTPTAARMVAADVNSERGVQVIKYLVARHERLTQLEKVGQPTFQIPQTYAEALRLAADTTEANERLTRQANLTRQIIGVAAGRLVQAQADLGAASHELAKAQVDLDVKEEQLGTAVTEKQEEERKAAAMARAVALEAESKILTGWLKEVQAVTGVGPRMATKVLQAYGILCRHKVEGCSNTDEPAISTRYLQEEWFCYKLQPVVGKTITEDKLDEEGEVIIGPDGKPVQIVVPVLDQDGNQTSVHSRTVKITPKGCPLIMNLLSTCNETLLCRLINLVKVKELRSLSGRYTFAEKHNFAHKLFPKSKDTVRKMIRFVEPKDSESGDWEVWTFLGDKGTCKVYGQGSTLEQAYMQLASNMKGLLPALDCI
jgi:phage anti-repressor protein